MHGEEIGFKGGADIIYDSKSKLEDSQNDTNSTIMRWDWKKTTFPICHLVIQLLTDNAPYHRAQEINLPFIVPVRLLFWCSYKII
jgi:hypothetical protein